jgi:hypothetical protein
MKFLNGWKMKIGSFFGGIAAFSMFLPPITIATIGGDPVTITAVATGLATVFLGTGVAGKADKLIDAQKRGE